MQRRHLKGSFEPLTACLILSILKLQECLGILAARCASCNCMTYFYCAPLQVYTPFRSAQNHCPPDNVRPAGGYIIYLVPASLRHQNTILLYLHYHSTHNPHIDCILLTMWACTICMGLAGTPFINIYTPFFITCQLWKKTLIIPFSGVPHDLPPPQ